MKIRFRLPLSIMAVCLLSVFSISCTQESYESGTGKYSLMRAEFVDAHTNGEGKIFSVMTDEGDSLLLTAPAERTWAAKADTTFRCLLYYNKVGNNAELISISSVPAPPIRETADLKEGLKSDPVKFVSSWTSTNRRYLNLELVLMTGSTDEDTALQKIGCVCDSVSTAADGSHHVWLSLYHDQGGVPEYYSANVYMSIMTSRLPIAVKEGDQVSVVIPTYSGKITRDFSF